MPLRCRVLIVENDPAYRRELDQYFATRHAGYTVTTAADGAAAIRLANKLQPDLVLLDLRLRHVDGFQVCREIKSNPKTSDTVVIGMTGYYLPEVEKMWMECGAVRVFAKPLEPSQAAAAVDDALGIQKDDRGRGKQG